MESKYCPSCKKIKKSKEFYKYTNGSLRYVCKICTNEKCKIYCEKNSLKISERRKKYYLKRHDYFIEKGKLYARSPKGKEAKLKTVKNSYKKFPEKFKARSKFHYYLRKGTIKRLPCEVCGEVKTEGHHQDYTKPLEVKWLCMYHHKLIEGKLTYL